MEASIMAVGLLHETQTRARCNDDWEQDFERLQQRAEMEEIKQALKSAALRVVSLFRLPAPTRRVAQA